MEQEILIHFDSAEGLLQFVKENNISTDPDNLREILIQIQAEPPSFEGWFIVHGKCRICSHIQFDICPDICDVDNMECGNCHNMSIEPVVEDMDKFESPDDFPEVGDKDVWIGRACLAEDCETCELECNRKGKPEGYAEDSVEDEYEDDELESDTMGEILC